MRKWVLNTFNSIINRKIYWGKGNKEKKLKTLKGKGEGPENFDQLTFRVHIIIGQDIIN